MEERKRRGRPPKPVRERIRDNVAVDDNGCWIWLRHVRPDGYGQMMVRDHPGRVRCVKAHRAVFEEFNGPIPDGLTLDHLCRVRACVNPEHLEPVTMRENTLRSPLSPPAVNARKSHCINGHPLAGDNLIIKYRSDGSERVCLACRRAQSTRGHARASAVSS